MLGHGRNFPDKRKHLDEESDESYVDYGDSDSHSEESDVYPDDEYVQKPKRQRWYDRDLPDMLKNIISANTPNANALDGPAPADGPDAAAAPLTVLILLPLLLKQRIGVNTRSYPTLKPKNKRRDLGKKKSILPAFLAKTPRSKAL